MSTGRYVVGIDLGTTHTAMACADLSDASAQPVIRVIEICQTVRPGAVEARPLLPSVIYLASENEFSEGSLALPWSAEASRTASGHLYCVGSFAQTRGAEVPGRSVASAKSWLCQPGSDRRSSILPWNAPAGVPRISPVEASSLILKHLCCAWEQAFAGHEHPGKLSQQKIVLCVPASFDAAARELTLEAARHAGLLDVTLLEEPQAAFYSWIEQSQDAWRKLVTVGELILVVDIGGGTTDFSLIAVEGGDGALSLRRIAVGEHILLGGDNMDLALAHDAAEKLAIERIELDDWQLRALALACREAKEKLLGDDDAVSDMPGPVKGTKQKSSRKSRGVAREISLSVLGRGSGVVGTSVRAALERDASAALLLDGFLPRVEPHERPRMADRSGLREGGLRYAADPAITKHLARFLAFEHTASGAQNAARSGAVKNPANVSALACPAAILFNGGVMKSRAFRERIAGVVSEWVTAAGGAAPRIFRGIDLDLAVARGAAYFGLAQRGKGVRIRAGVARCYYIGIESTAPAVPGKVPAFKALCVVPFGMEEGAQVEVPQAEFGLVVGEAAQFRFLTSATRRGDQPGDVIENWNGDLQELSPIEAVLPPADGCTSGTLVPVRLKSKLTAVGMLELWCREAGGAGEWKLELNVRER